MTHTWKLKIDTYQEIFMGKINPNIGFKNEFQESGSKATMIPPQVR
jgi:hypothetical protein